MAGDAAVNIRFDSRSVRVRVSLEEAMTLNQNGRLVENFASGNLSVEISLALDQDTAMRYHFEGKRVELTVRKRDLTELLLVRPSREESIRTEVIETRAEPIEVIFEIDLFTRKKKGKPS